MMPGIVAGRAVGGGAGPTPISFTESVFATVVTTHAVSMPATVAAGDMLVMDGFFRGGVGNAVSVPSGWTMVDEESRTSGSVVFLKGVYYRIADGSEGSTTVDFETAVGSRLAAVVVRFGVGTFSGSPEAIASQGASTSPDPPNLSPSGGAGNYCWFATAGANNGDAEWSTYPFADGQAVFDGANNTALARCYLRSSASSIDPGSFTITSARDWIAHTWAISS